MQHSANSMPLGISQINGVLEDRMYNLTLISDNKEVASD